MALFNYEQQMKMWEATNYAAQRKQMEKAGLNVGLMYGKGGGGGATTAANPGNVSGQKIDMTSGNALQGMGMMLQAKQTEAQANLANAQADEIRSRTPTSGNTGDINLENLRQTGIGQLQDNKLKAWLMSDADVRGGTDYNEKYDYHVSVGEGSQYAKQIDAQLLKTASETNSNLAGIDLTNQKIAGYWTELLNETKKADAAGIQAAASKLSSEWNTGEFTNWKTWADQAQKSIQAIKGLMNKGTEINKTNTYNQHGDRWSE
jgi:hypothetical protein